MGWNVNFTLITEYCNFHQGLFISCLRFWLLYGVALTCLTMNLWAWDLVWLGNVVDQFTQLFITQLWLFDKWVPQESKLWSTECHTCSFVVGFSQALSSVFALDLTLHFIPWTESPIESFISSHWSKLMDVYTSRL